MAIGWWWGCRNRTRVLGPRETRGGERKSQTGAEFDRTWLANGWTRCVCVCGGGVSVGAEGGTIGRQEGCLSSAGSGLLEEKCVWSR